MFDQRLKGYKQALEDHDLEVQDEYIVEKPIYDEMSFDKIMKQFDQLNHSVDAILCASDVLAPQLIFALRDRKIKVPDDLSILCFTNDPLFLQFEPNLTTMQRQVNVVAKESAEALMGIIKNPLKKPEKIIIPAVFVERGSVKDKTT